MIGRPWDGWRRNPRLRLTRAECDAWIRELDDLDRAIRILNGTADVEEQRRAEAEYYAAWPNGPSLEDIRARFARKEPRGEA